jgi:hypothetical protein
LDSIAIPAKDPMPEMTGSPDCPVGLPFLCGFPFRGGADGNHLARQRKLHHETARPKISLHD